MDGFSWISLMVMLAVLVVSVIGFAASFMRSIGSWKDPWETDTEDPAPRD